MSSSRLTGKRSESCHRSVDALKNPEHIVEYHCKRLSSTLDGIQNCPFAREFEIFSDSSPSSLTFTPLQSQSQPQPQPQTQPTGIIMLSLPSTDDSVRHSFPLEENEEFETPPEHNNSSQPYFSGNDDPKPGSTVDSQLNGDADTVNLGKDCDDLGFPNPREIGVPNRGDFEEHTPKRIRISEEDVDTKISSRKIGKKLVDGNAKMSEKGEEGGDGEVHSESEGLLEVDECRIQRIVDSFTEKGNLEVDEHRIERNVESSIEEVCERSDEDGDGEVHENGGKKVDENEQCSGEIHGNGMKDGFNNGGSERGAMSMDLDGNDKLNGICTEKMHSSVEGRRELPSSIRGVNKNVEEVRRGVETPSFKDILEAFSIVVGGISGNDNNVDFLETAKKRGMTFPRPRWWPPEGFDD